MPPHHVTSGCRIEWAQAAGPSAPPLAARNRGREREDEDHREDRALEQVLGVLPPAVVVLVEGGHLDRLGQVRQHFDGLVRERELLAVFLTKVGVCIGDPDKPNVLMLGEL